MIATTDAVGRELRDRADDLRSLATLVAQKLEGPHKETLVSSLESVANGLERMADEQDRFRENLRVALHTFGNRPGASASSVVAVVRGIVARNLGEALPAAESIHARRHRVRQERWRQDLSALEESIDRERTSEGLPPIYGTVEYEDTDAAGEPRVVRDPVR